jgi:hypothetical protein
MDELGENVTATPADVITSMTLYAALHEVTFDAIFGPDVASIARVLDSFKKKTQPLLPSQTYDYRDPRAV